MIITDSTCARDQIVVNVILNRGKEAEELLRMRLAAFKNWVSYAVEQQRIFSLYDALDGLRDIGAPKPLPFYAHIGWSCEDLVHITEFINDKKIMLRFNCKRWL